MKTKLILISAFAFSLAFAGRSYGDTTYFTDDFTITDGDTYNIDDQIGSPRQGGTLAGSGVGYAELSATASGGNDYQTQVDNTYPSLLLAANSSLPTVYASPDLDLPTNDVSISFTVNLGSLSDANGFSYFNFGSDAQGEAVNGSDGLGLAMYADGSWDLFNGSTNVASGSGTALAAGTFVPVNISLESGEVYLSINGVEQDLNGAAAGDGYADTVSSNYITFGQDNTTGSILPTFFGPLEVSGTVPEPGSVGLLVVGLVAVLGWGRVWKPGVR